MADTSGIFSSNGNSLDLEPEKSKFSVGHIISPFLNFFSILQKSQNDHQVHRSFSVITGVWMVPCGTTTVLQGHSGTQVRKNKMTRFKFCFRWHFFIYLNS